MHLLRALTITAIGLIAAAAFGHAHSLIIDPVASSAPMPGSGDALLYSMLALVVVQGIAYAIKRISPDDHFFHTPLGTAAIALISAVLGAVAPAIQASGLNFQAIAFAALSGALSFFTIASPGPAARALVMFFALGALADCAGCPPNVQQLGVDIGACAAGVVPGALVGLVQQTVGSLLGTPGTPSWATYSTGQLLSQGVNAATCAVAAAVHDLATKVPKTGQVDPAYVDAIILGQDWLVQHGVGVSLPDHVQTHVDARRAKKAMLQLGPPVPIAPAVLAVGFPMRSPSYIESCIFDMCTSGECVCIDRIVPGLGALTVAQ